MKPTEILSFIGGGKAANFSLGKAMKETDVSASDIAGLGFSADAKAVSAIKSELEEYAKDAGLALGDGNIDALTLSFMHWYEPAVNALYKGRQAFDIFGSVQMGDFLTETVVFKKRKLTGGVSLYDDWSRPFLAGYNYGYDTRDTLRVEFGKEVTYLEEQIAGKMRRNADRDKMDAIVLKDAIFQDDAFFYGVNIGDKRIYGINNEPGISNRVTNLPYDLEATTTGVDEMVSMLGAIKQQLIDDLQGNGDVNALPVKIVVPNKWQSAFTRANSYNGFTAYKWLAENWKNAEVKFSVKCDTLDDGEPKMMVYVENVPGVGVNSLMLITTSKLRLIGAMPSLKGRTEAYASAIAGAMAACPVAIRFYTAPGDSSSDSDSDASS